MIEVDLRVMAEFIREVLKKKKGTLLTVDQILSVLDAEEEYLKEIGVITEEDFE